MELLQERNTMRYYALGNQKEALQKVIDAVSEMESEIVAQSKEIQQLRKERDEARQENKDLLWMLDKRRSSPDCDDLNHESKHQNHGDICPVLTQYNTLAQKYGV